MKIIWLSIAVYAAVFSYLSINRMNSLNARYFDLGIMHQAVHNTYVSIKTGDFSRFLEITSPNPPGTTPAQVHRFAVHSDGVLAALAPFYFLYDGPETLLIIQSLALALGAWPVFKITRKIFSDSRRKEIIAMVFSLAYLFNPVLQKVNLFEFHAVTLAIPLLLMMFYFALEKRYGVAAIFLAISLLAKEQIALTTAFFGLYHLVGSKFWSHRRPADQNRFAFGIFAIGTSFLFFIFSMYVIIPYFRSAGHFGLEFYQSFGDSPLGVIGGALTNPVGVYDRMSYGGPGRYLISLFGPLGLAPILSPGVILIALPELAINLISSNIKMKTIELHYAAVLIPFLFISAIYGGKRLADLLERYAKLSGEVAIMLLLGISSLYFAYDRGPLPFGREATEKTTMATEARQFSGREIQKLLAGEEIKVFATSSLAPFFSGRHYFYNYPDYYRLADFVLLDKLDVGRNRILQQLEKTIQNSADFKMTFSDANLEVYQKIK